MDTFFTQRKLGLTLEWTERKGPDSVMALDGYRVVAKIPSGDESDQPVIDVSGLVPNQLARIARSRQNPAYYSDPILVTLYSREDGGNQPVTICRAYVNYADILIDPPENVLRLTLINTYSLQRTSSTSINITGPASLPDALKAVLPSFDGEILVMPGLDVDGKELPIPYVPPMATMGSDWDRALAVCQSVDYKLTYQPLGNILTATLLRKGNEVLGRRLPIVHISQRTGMHGFPRMQDMLTFVSTLAKTDIQLFQFVNLDSRSAAFPDGIPFMDGPLEVVRFQHTLSSDLPGGPWVTELCLRDPGQANAIWVRDRLKQQQQLFGVKI